MKSINDYFRSIKVKILTVSMLVIFTGSTLVAAENFEFVNYTQKSGNGYVYTTDKLGTKYSNDIQNFFCADGEKWSMQSSVSCTSINLYGGLDIVGSTTIKNKSLFAGYTGGSFVNVTDENGMEMYLGSTKSGLPLGTIDVDRNLAGEVGWGIKTAKANIYVAGYITKKIAWWKVKLPVIKTRVIPAVRTVTWEIEIPAYIMSSEINIEVLNSHTPTYRVIQSIEKAGNITYSFALQCGLPTALLAFKIYRGSFQISDFENYICNVIAWAAAEDLLDEEKSKNVQKILRAIGDLVDTYKDGLNFQEQMDLVTMGFDIVTMISNKNFDISSLGSFMSSLESILIDSDGNIVSRTLEEVQVILENLKPLLKLSDEQEEVYDSVLATFYFINGLGSDTSSSVYTALNGFQLVFDIYSKVKNNEITVTNAEVLIDNWLDRVGVVIAGTAPEYSDEFQAYRSTVGNVLVKIMILANNKNWL